MRITNIHIALIIILLGVGAAFLISSSGARTSTEPTGNGRTLRTEEIPQSFVGTITPLTGGWHRYSNDLAKISIDVPPDMKASYSGLMFAKGNVEYPTYNVRFVDRTGYERIFAIGVHQAQHSLAEEYVHWYGDDNFFTRADAAISNVPAITRIVNQDTVHPMSEEARERTTIFIWNGYFIGIMTRDMPIADVDRIRKSIQLIN